MRHFYSKKANRNRRNKGNGSAPSFSFEALEDRRMLAAVTVSTAADLVDGNTTTIASLIADPGADNAVSLREALAAANNSSDTDTITFDASVFNGEAVDVIRLQSSLSIAESVEIDGGALGVVVSGDSSGNDTLVAGSFVTDTFASDATGALSDNTNRVFELLGAPGQTATISGLTITGGASSGSGGGILVDSSNLTLNQSTVAGNRSTNSGGGIASSGGDVVISESTISGNVADGLTGQGGGVSSVFGSLTLSSSTVSGNIATSTIGVSAGGGVFVGSQSSVINDSTISENTADFGGGISIDSPFSAVTLDLANSIVANNTALSASADIATGFSVSVDARFSLIGDHSGTSLAPTTGPNTAANLIGSLAAPVNAHLAPLADNGGLTKTHALMGASPAINAGSSLLALDQRGTPRVFGSNSDIGAVELQRTFLVVDTSQGFEDGNFFGGNFSLAEAIELSNLTPEVETIVFDSTVFNGEAADVIHLQDPLFISQSVTIDGGDLDVVISGDTSGNDRLIAGTFISDVERNFSDFDNVRPISINTNFGDTVTLRNLTITGGSTSFQDGGGIRSRGADLVIEASIVSGNLADFTENGGGIAIVDGSLTVTDSIISANDAEDASGGGIYTRDADITLVNSTVSGNRASRSGGGIFSDDGLVTVVTSEISDNFAQRSGGGIFANDVNVIVDRSTISGNEASSDDGGGIKTDDGSITVSNSTISGNFAGDDGGGIFTSEGDVTITDSTLTLNRADGSGGGIAIAPFFSARQPLLTVNNSIIADNQFDISQGPNVAPSDISSSLLGNVGSLLDAAPIGSPDANGNLVGTNTNPIDPLIGDLADNGGPTKTHALLPGSPAIDTGDTTSTTDQRGEARPNINGTLPDIGAFEVVDLGPQVGDVILSSSSFSDNFIDAIDGDEIGESNGLGYSLVGEQQLTSVPWQNIDTLHLQFLDDLSASLDDGDILLTGTNGGNYSLGPISFDTTTYVATVPIVGGIGNDSLVISIFEGTVTDSDGDAVVGDDGGQFNFRFNVLPGDADGSGQVNSLDATNTFASNTELSIAENARRDIDGSGQITSNDAFAAFANNTSGLPSSPTAPIGPASLTSSSTAPLAVVAIDAAFSEQRLLEEPVKPVEVFETPILEVAVLQKIPASNDSALTKSLATVESSIQSPGSDAVSSVLEEPTQSTVLPTTLVHPRSVTSSAIDRTVTTLSNEPEGLSLSPELSLAGHVEVEVAEATEREYFSVELETAEEVDLALLDSFFQENFDIVSVE